jgi:hypothetical protein
MIVPAPAGFWNRCRWVGAKSVRPWLIGTAFGYRRHSLAAIEPGEYWVQGVLNIYQTYHLKDGAEH